MKNPLNIFLDRDGVINFDSPDYIKNCEELSFIPGSIEAIAMLSKLGYKIFIITNQSVIGRKYVSEKGLKKIFAKMINSVENKNGKITDIFFCPHIPEDNCTCRKPAPGLFFQAEKKYGLNLKNSVMVGDSAKDIIAALNAGINCKILVKTGNGLKSYEELQKKGISYDYTAENLADAANWIIEKTGF